MATDREKVPGEKRLAWGYPVAAGILWFAAPLSWEAAQDNVNGVWASPWAWAAGAALLAAALVTYKQGTSALSALRDSRGRITDFNYSLVDTIKALGELPDKGGPEARKQFFDTVIREAKSIMKLEGQRVCVYELDSADGDAGEGDRLLRLVDHGGRPDYPREEFTSADEHGRAAIANATANVTQCYDSLEKPFVVSKHPRAPWKSFIVVPLHVDKKPRGMMTIDTTKDMCFTSDHIAVATTIGCLIEIGLKSSYSAAVETSMDVRATQQLLATIESGEQQPSQSVRIESQDQQEGR